MSRRRRRLSAEERALWDRIARSATPLDPDTRPHAKADPGADSSRHVRQTPAQPAPDPAATSGTMFRVGQATRPGPSIHDRAPSPAERLSGAPVRMDHKVHKRMSQGKLRPEARLDLHGMTLAAAHPELIRFILSCQRRGMRLVLVITGKGKGGHGPLPTRPGALRHQVPHWLHSPPLSAAVQQVAPAHYRHGGEGAYYVYLRRAAG